jgi:hypothetical protein
LKLLQKECLGELSFAVDVSTPQPFYFATVKVLEILLIIFIELLKDQAILILMRLKQLALILFCFILFSGCQVLTDSQVKNINAFATAAKHYTNFPDKVFKERAELHLNNELLQASQFSDAAIIERTVNNARNHYKTVLALSDTLNGPLKLLQQYALLLVKLSSDKYATDLSASTTDLNENLDNLFKAYNEKAEKKLPVDIGKQISNVVFLVGKRMTKHRQAKALKKFIIEGNELVKATTDDLVDVLDKESFVGLDGMTYAGLKTLLEQEKNVFITNYTNIVFSNTQANGNKISYQSVQSYASTLAAYESVEALRQKTVAAATKLAKAHDVLAKDMERRKNLKEIQAEIQDLIGDVQGLNEVADSLKKGSTGKE